MYHQHCTARQWKEALRSIALWSRYCRNTFFSAACSGWWLHSAVQKSAGSETPAALHVWAPPIPLCAPPAPPPRPLCSHFAPSLVWATKPKLIWNKLQKELNPVLPPLCPLTWLGANKQYSTSISSLVIHHLKQRPYYHQKRPFHLTEKYIAHCGQIPTQRKGAKSSEFQMTSGKYITSRQQMWNWNATLIFYWWENESAPCCNRHWSQMAICMHCGPFGFLSGRAIVIRWQCNHCKCTL